ncbi:MAG: hypothetical protein LBH22_04040 [Bacteroidales bacterium]|jgi:hypothetical protein|nr:hypothetical protein [Bacteroidales bacterium]
MNTSDEILASQPIISDGAVLLLVLMGIVALYVVYNRYGKPAVENHRTKRHAKNAAKEAEVDVLDIPANVLAGSEEFAAIAAVIHMYHSELHDEENTIMTINKVARAYSPWSSKLYFQNQYFNLYRRR